ncbi:hypothetical protein [Streptoalloteichus hindustanus]|uniref:Uncharacterized protein n=1 Tax=Streptoalloteichus hindustanus TaxID=2017 RepID=A0A1M5EKE8_STRHI|nr:hypothetical protein [Streptoalloteichus hindustanus]SHF79656.1 hypothetical protein SAMN05444320_10524 [Streptoalloteichus hindustanus]
MRNPRFIDLFEQIVSAWPEVVKYERVELGKEGAVQRVTFTDGIEIDFRIVNGAPDSGDDATQPEKIVTKYDKQVR